MSGYDLLKGPFAHLVKEVCVSPTYWEQKKQCNKKLEEVMRALKALCKKQQTPRKRNKTLGWQPNP